MVVKIKDSEAWFTLPGIKAWKKTLKQFKDDYCPSKIDKKAHGNTIGKHATNQ